MSKTRLESIGAFYPEQIQSTSDLMQRMVNDTQFDLEEITGVKNRRVCGENEDSLFAALSAATTCLNNSDYTAEEIDIVISCSISRYIDSKTKMYFEPALSLYLKKRLGLKNAIHFDISNACAGMMTGVQLLDSMIRSGKVKNGLVVSGEYITSIADTATKEITDGRDPQFSALTVGDSGAAVIMDSAVNEQDQIDYIELMTCAEYADLCIATPSEKTPQLALYTNNAEMQKKDRVQLWPHFLAAYYKKTGRNLAEENFDFVIHHQVSKKAVSNFSRFGETILDIELPPQLNCLENFGNTASTSHFIVLYKHLQEGVIKPGSKILLVPLASGIIAGCVSFTLSNLKVK